MTRRAEGCENMDECHLLHGRTRSRLTVDVPTHVIRSILKKNGGHAPTAISWKIPSHRDANCLNAQLPEMQTSREPVSP